MSNWAARAKAHFSESAQNVTPISPRRPLVGVLGVPSGGISTKDGDLLGLLGAPSQSIFELPTVHQLFAAAMRACDHFNDSEEGREAMRQEVMEVPPEQWSALIAHFNTTYKPVLAGRKQETRSNA